LHFVFSSENEFAIAAETRGLWLLNNGIVILKTKIVSLSSSLMEKKHLMKWLNWKEVI
jgi:hypothetical protein